MNIEFYTKIFLKAADLPVDDVLIREHIHLWWKNTRNKEGEGLRLTKEGFEMLEEIDLKLYEIPFHDKLKFTTQILIFLDQFIDCPYYITPKCIYVTNEKKAVELTMLSGDIRKYGLAKAATRLKEKSVNIKK